MIRDPDDAMSAVAAGGCPPDHAVTPPVTVATVAALTMFPVKACAGSPVDRCALTPTGLAGDRRFMVVDAEGRFRTQRGHPRLATVTPRLDADTVTLTAPGVDELGVAVAADGPRRAVEIFGRGHDAVDQGDAAAEWFSTVLGAPSRLVGVAPGHRRPTDGRIAGLTGWADSGSVLLLSGAAADEVSDRAVERSGAPVPIDRFRANVVLAGCDAHVEDDLDVVVLGSAGLAFAKRAVRCAVATVDQRRGERDGPEPLATLATYRNTDDGVVFGATYTVVTPGEVAVGDRLSRGVARA